MGYFLKDSVTLTIRSSKTRLLSCTVQTVLFALCILGIGLTTSASATDLVSVNKDGNDSGNDISHWPVISADGRFVVFQSYASDLGAVDTNGEVDIFVRDLQAGTTTLVSVNSAGNDSGNGESYGAVISADGRFVAFVSEASDLVATDTKGERDIFVRDLQAGTTTLVSVNSAGTDSGNSWSESPVISANGRFVAFQSEANDLAVADTNQIWDIFVRDLQSSTTTLVSVNSAGNDSGNDRSIEPVISTDGRFVVFRSWASDLGATDTNDEGDVFVRDLQAGTTTIVSVNSAGIDSGNDRSIFSEISADGRFVVFSSRASDLVTTDTNGTSDVFVRDLQEGTTTLVSVNSAGTDSGNNWTLWSTISANGRLVAFSSWASDLVSTDSNNNHDVFVRDLQAGTTTLVSINKAGTDSGNDNSGSPVFSSDSRFLAFQSYASDLGATDTNETRDVYVRDLQVGTTTLVSINSDGSDSGDSESYGAVPSADGRYVAFHSWASDLVATDTNDDLDVFVFELLGSDACDCDDPNAITGSPGADKLTGTRGDDIICGFEGNDRIYGGKGNDCIDGGDGKDKIYGGKGHDMILGRKDNDILYGNSGDDTIEGGDGVDKIYGGSGQDLIFGQMGNDRLYGNGDDDSIDGGDGMDKIAGGRGHDQLFGGKGDDRLYGYHGDDYIEGGDGKDKLSGWRGRDKLLGGKGNDKLWGHHGNDRIDGGDGFDKIYGGTGRDKCINGERTTSCER